MSKPVGQGISWNLATTPTILKLEFLVYSGGWVLKRDVIIGSHMYRGMSILGIMCIKDNL